MTQCDSILQALQQGPMTSTDIYHELGIYRAGSRISELRKSGHQIRTDMVEVRNRFGELVRVGCYTLLSTTKKVS